MPPFLPNYLHREVERYTQWAPSFARLIGCAVIEANHCGSLRCPMPVFGFPYRTKF
jgi:hypothetical protein